MRCCIEGKDCHFMQRVAAAEKLDQGSDAKYHTTMMYRIDAEEEQCPHWKAIRDKALKIKPKTLFSHSIAPRG